LQCVRARHASRSYFRNVNYDDNRIWAIARTTHVRSFDAISESSPTGVHAYDTYDMTIDDERWNAVAKRRRAAGWRFSDENVNTWARRKRLVDDVLTGSLLRRTDLFARPRTSWILN
jgi:hypothetical protein